MSGLRNLGYDDLHACYILGPLVDLTHERVLAALRDALASPRGARLHYLRTRGGRWRRAEPSAALAASARAVESVEGVIDRSELADRAMERVFGPGELPVRILINQGLIAFGFPHSLYDGGGATAVASLVVEKLGTPGVDTVPAVPWAKAPLRTAMKRLGLTGPAGIRTARRIFRSRNAQTETAYPFSRTLTKTESVARTRTVSFMLPADGVRAIASIPEQAVEGRRPARPPVSLKAASLVLRCLRDSSHDGADFRVVIPIDARRWVPRGFDVEGNFAPSIPMGRLMSDEWSATALTERISAATKSGVPVAWLLATTLISLKNAVRHPVASRRVPDETPRVPLEVHVSLPTTEVVVDEALMPHVDAATFVGGLPEHLRLPLGVWVEITPLRGGLHVIVRDETGAFDLDGFEERLHALIAADANV